MPFTRILLLEGRTDRDLKLISDTLHQTLVDEFIVPVKDRFQIIETYSAARLIYDQHYLTGCRSKDYILFYITAGKPRTLEQKQNFYRVLTQRLVDKLNITPDDVMIIIQFTTKYDWCFGNGKLFEEEKL